MDSDEFYEFENRAYINPTLSSGEQEAFISNLRDTQSQNNAQIQEQTYNLGTRVPSNLGGLGGGEAYFNARYQTPRVDEMIASLKTAAQAQAFNDAVNNYNSQLQNRYKQAYRDYQKRQSAKAAAPAGGNTGNTGNVVGSNIDVTDSSISVSDEDKTITSVPIEGHTTTSYYDGANWVAVDETTGERYVNGKLQSTPNTQKSVAESLLTSIWNTMTMKPTSIVTGGM